MVGCGEGAPMGKNGVVPVLPSRFPTHQMKAPSWGSMHISGTPWVTTSLSCSLVLSR